MALVLMIRPDPKEVATNLARYYPGYVPAAPRSGAAAPPASTGARAWIAHYPLRVAFVSSFAAQGTMTLMMAMTSLALDHHGHALPMISLSVAIHVVGMFGFSIPLGRLADRVGRRNMLVVGSLISALGSVLVAFGADYWPISLGTFLVGLGWCCTHVSVTAMIADFVPPTDRGRAIGTNDSFSTLGSVLLPLAGGPLVELFGLPILAVVGAGLMVVPLLLQLRLSGGRADR
jgi:MFS family permease